MLIGNNGRTIYVILFFDVLYIVFLYNIGFLSQNLLSFFRFSMFIKPIIGYSALEKEGPEWLGVFFICPEFPTYLKKKNFFFTFCNDYSFYFFFNDSTYLWSIFVLKALYEYQQRNYVSLIKFKQENSVLAPNNIAKRFEML